MLTDLSALRKENERLYWRFHKAIAERDREVIGVVLFRGIGGRWLIDMEAYAAYIKEKTAQWLRENDVRQSSPSFWKSSKTIKSKCPVAAGR